MDLSVRRQVRQRQTNGVIPELAEKAGARPQA